MTRTSTAYIGTFDRSATSAEKLAYAKRLVSEYNKNTNGTKYRVKLQGRLGKDNPNAVKYRKGAGKRYRPYQCIKLADAAYFDAYVYRQA